MDELDQLEDRVRRHVARSEMYSRERMEAFGIKWHTWLLQAIRQALYNLHGWVDENLVEPLRDRLLRRGMK